MGVAQLLPRIRAPLFAAEPLAVEQMRAGQLEREPATAEPVDRLAVELLLRTAASTSSASDRVETPSSS
jgi:hypothetical protein